MDQINSLTESFEETRGGTSNGPLEAAFKTIAAVHAARNLIELNILFRPALEKLGFNLFAAIKLAKPSGRIDVRALFGEGFQEWLDHYLRNGYAADDCIIEECFKTTEPFCWSDVVRRGGLPPRAIKILQDAYAFGLKQGVVAPVRKHDGSIFVVLFAGQSFDSQNPNVVSASHLLASYYGIAGGHLYATERTSKTQERQLTNRQVECLKWVRAGKTSAEIGEIVGISPRVVNEHVWTACRRLGVRTRAQAVLAASSAGFLDA